jgi:hypothetical protein
VLDTGALNHMSGSQATFSSINNGNVGTVKFVDGSMVRIKGIGIVLFECKNGEHQAFTVVYFIPHLTTSIISVGQLDEEGYEVLIRGGVMSLRDLDQRLLARVNCSPGKLYKMQLRIVEPVCLSACTGNNAWLWHSRFGHMNFSSLRRMGTTSHVKGLPVLDQVDELCDACLVGKHKRDPFPQVASRRSVRALELLHGDLCGLVSLPIPSGNKFFLLVDDYSRYMWVSLMPSKDHVVSAIKRI